MTHLTLDDVTSTILANSYYEVLATTTIDGKTVVTEPDDVFLVKTALITIEELRNLLDYRLVSVKDAAVRFHALALALNPKTTDKQLYYAMIKYDFHPELVSVVTAIGKSFVMGTVKLVKRWENYNCALLEAASGGRLKAMKLIKDLGAMDFDWVLTFVAGKGRVEAMTLLKDWGATDFESALSSASGEGCIKDMALLKDWGATDFDSALAYAAAGGHVGCMILLETWGATKYNCALALAAAAGQVEAMKLLKNWGAVANDYMYALSIRYRQLKAAALLKEWINK